MDIAALRSELQNDPMNFGYSGMADSEVADSMNEPSRQGRKSVAATDVRLYVLLHGLWAEFEDVAKNNPEKLYRRTAISILQTLAPNSFDTIRMGNPQVYAAVGSMLQTMVDCGSMTQQNRQEMLSMGDVLISRADEIGLGTVHHIHVAEARNG